MQQSGVKRKPLSFHYSASFGFCSSFIRISDCVIIIILKYYVTISCEMGEQVKQGVDQNKIQEFMNKAIGDIASSSSTMLTILGKDLACINQWPRQTDQFHLKN